MLQRPLQRVSIAEESCEVALPSENEEIESQVSEDDEAFGSHTAAARRATELYQQSAGYESDVSFGSEDGDYYEDDETDEDEYEDADEAEVPYRAPRSKFSLLHHLGLAKKETTELGSVLDQQRADKDHTTKASSGPINMDAFFEESRKRKDLETKKVRRFSDVNT
jgi:hypothetical protein